jgi:hypothetical protein
MQVAFQLLCTAYEYLYAKIQQAHPHGQYSLEYFSLQTSRHLTDNCPQGTARRLVKSYSLGTIVREVSASLGTKIPYGVIFLGGF